MWRHYYQGTQGLIFVIDSNDRERIQEAKDELHKVLSDDLLREARVLIFANKQDLPKALRANELIEKLNLNGLKQQTWFIQPCVATTGEGLFEGSFSNDFVLFSNCFF